MKWFIIMSIFISSFVMISTHPLLLTMLISIQSMLVALLISYSFNSVWFSLILFLVFLGGLMVLFIYISSLASNEYMTMEKCTQKILLVLLMLTMTILIINTEAPIFKHTSLLINNLINKTYSMPIMPLLVFTMVYLLMVLIVAASIISLQEGPLRNTVKL